MLKTLDRYILKNYLLPFVATFFVMMFILMMQFVWKYVDDLVGKGLSPWIIGELLFYVSATLVPLALPLTILLSSIMAFGNLAESYELTAIKSAGISLLRVMRPLMLVSLVVSILAFLFSNFVLPVANLKMGSLLYDISHQKPTLEIKEGVFYNGIENFTILVGRKSKDGKTMYNLMIYDHSDHYGNRKLVTARKGRMELTADERFLLFNLYDGHSYEEAQKREGGHEVWPMIRSTFGQQTIRMDLSDFKMTRSDERLFKDHYAMLNIRQLNQQVDSSRMDQGKRHGNFFKQIEQLSGIPDRMPVVQPFPITDTLLKPIVTYKALLESMSLAGPDDLYGAAENMTRGNLSYVESSVQEMNMIEESISRYLIEFHKKFTLAFACMVLFFVGAPLGAIIRKGGLGMPVVASVILFLIFHVISIMGEKSAKEGVLEPWLGAWLATLVLFPLGVFLTYKAAMDSALFDKDAYKRLWRKILWKAA